LGTLSSSLHRSPNSFASSSFSSPSNLIILSAFQYGFFCAQILYSLILATLAKIFAETRAIITYFIFM
jgi:hypothetical protein